MQIRPTAGSNGSGGDLHEGCDAGLILHQAAERIDVAAHLGKARERLGQFDDNLVRFEPRTGDHVGEEHHDLALSLRTLLRRSARDDGVDLGLDCADFVRLATGKQLPNRGWWLGWTRLEVKLEGNR